MKGRGSDFGNGIRSELRLEMKKLRNEKIKNEV